MNAKEKECPRSNDDDARFFAGAIIAGIFGGFFYWAVYELYTAIFS
jgi:hypothetical protein